MSFRGIAVRASLISVGKESACNAGDPGSIPGLGRSPGEGKGYPLQYSSLENSVDCIVHGVAKSRTRLSDGETMTVWDKRKIRCPQNGRRIRKMIDEKE